MKKLTFFSAVLLSCMFTWSISAQPSGAKNADIKPYPESLDVVSVLDFGAKGDGVTDNTAAFQKAMDSFGEAGGTVYVPRGSYLFKGSLNIPKAVTLKGVIESVPSHTGVRFPGGSKPGDDGTTFLVTGNRGNESAEPFITLNTNSTLKGVVMFWPDQQPNEIPAAYPWAVAMRGDNPAILDVELLNPYNAIDASKNVRGLIRNISGQPLRRGIYVDGIYDVGRIENVHWNPWWSMQPVLFDWQIQNGEGFIFERTDWHYVFNTFCFGYKVGYKFGSSQSATGSCNGNFVGIGADGCDIAILVEQTAMFGVLISNGEFVSIYGDDPTMLVVNKTNTGNVRIVNSAFWGHKCAQIAKIDGNGTISLSNCIFMQWDTNKENKAAIQAYGGNVSVTNSEFSRPGEGSPQVYIGENVKKAIITNNFIESPEIRIENHAKNVNISGNLAD